eukprot:688171-Rhodomonas_salina.1
MKVWFFFEVFFQSLGKSGSAESLLKVSAHKLTVPGKFGRQKNIVSKFTASQTFWHKSSTRFQGVFALSPDSILRAQLNQPGRQVVEVLTNGLTQPTCDRFAFLGPSRVRVRGNRERDSFNYLLPKRVPAKFSQWRTQSTFACATSSLISGNLRSRRGAV